MVKLLIPTRNRPTSLAGVLGFLRRFYPATSVIIADGSAEEHKPANRQSISTVGDGMDIDYRPYPYELPYFDRILDVLRSESEPYIVMGADDDFPMMDVFDQGAAFLAANDDFSTSLGARLVLKMPAPDQMAARLNAVRHIGAPRPEHRAKFYSRWSFPTTYAVTRRRHLVQRYERARHSFLGSFYDFTVGVHDVTVGKIHAVPGIATVSTQNFNHSYLRPDDRLLFLRRAGEVLEIMGTIVDDLQKKARLDKVDAEDVGATIIRNKIAENCGGGFVARQGFATSKLYNNKIVQAQAALARDLFVPGTGSAREYGDRIACIVSCLQKSARSQDNAGEDATYETLSEQMARPSQGAAAKISPNAIASNKASVPPNWAFATRPFDPRNLTYLE